jgi:hypothetical protein
MFSSLLAVIQNFSYDVKYIIETVTSTNFGVEIFLSCYMGIWSVYFSMTYLRSVLTIDTRFLLGRYANKLFMICAYDIKQQLLSLAFAVVVDDKSVEN